MLDDNTLYLIFEFLDPKDLIQCSLVDKQFYKLSLNNYLWFQMTKKEFSKVSMCKSETMRYNKMVNYKTEFLTFFNQRYHSQFLQLYTEGFLKYLVDKTNWYEKLLVIPIFLIPSYILLFPFGISIEIVNGIKHVAKKYEYCACESCWNLLYKKCKTLGDYSNHNTF
jgi:hypothetical protein